MWARYRERRLLGRGLLNSLSGGSFTTSGCSTGMISYFHPCKRYPWPHKFVNTTHSQPLMTREEIGKSVVCRRLSKGVITIPRYADFEVLVTENTNLTRCAV